MGRKILLACVLAFAHTAAMAASDLAEEVTSYMDFASYDAGILLPEQITRDVFEAAKFVETRDAAQLEAETIPSAIHIQWREIPARLDELPQSGLVNFCCNTGTLSAQATFAARLFGRENVVVFQTGWRGWHETGAYGP